MYYQGKCPAAASCWPYNDTPLQLTLIPISDVWYPAAYLHFLTGHQIGELQTYEIDTYPPVNTGGHRAYLSSPDRWDVFMHLF